MTKKAYDAVQAALRKQRGMPEPLHIWYLWDGYAGKYRVGRSDWPGDTFDMLTREEFEERKAAAALLSIPVKEVEED